MNYNYFKRTIVLVYLFIVIAHIFSCGSNESKSGSSTKRKATTTSEIIETRLCNRDGVNIRKGPGINFEKDESGGLINGEKLYVLEEKDEWIKFRVTQKDVGWSGWVRKDLTDPMSTSHVSKEKESVQKLKELGLLVSINPNLNEALVDFNVWNALDHKTKENIGRSLAFYCGQEKGTNLNWVDIKNSNTGQRLAKYSESWGFKVY